MMVWLFLFREMLGAVRAKGAAFFVLSGVLLCTFLAFVASFLMISPVRISATTEGQPIDEIHVYLSPAVPSSTVNQVFLAWREHQDIARLTFRFAHEIDPTLTGSVFLAVPTSQEAVLGLISMFQSLDGVVEVQEIPRVEWVPSPTVPSVVRIGLLVGLVLAVGASLLLFRKGTSELLESFSGEIRLLRLSGIPQRYLVTLTMALGLLIGLLGGLFLFAAVYILHRVGHATEALVLFEGLASGGRIVTVGLLSVALGLVLGGLAGLLGASALSSREFDPLP